MVMKQTAESSQPAARKTTLGCVALAALFVLAAPGNATAATPIENSHERFSDTFENSYCGIDGISVVEGVNHVIRFPGTFPTFIDNLEVTETFTATDSQRSIVFHFANQFTRRTQPTDNGDGTLTFTVTFKGLFEQIRIADGPVLSFDAGTITFANTFYANGPFISSELVEMHGPHPDADGSIFCDVVAPALI
jgi:hypothetical protein